ncbi:MAG: hypothetical protein BWY39_01145 [Spirochaetes bacterium ADurb.Bin269]|nr:MAG: hypothetical protein BWY39_01145 [Spirochaetes bacterium ADurb.Bin269]
MTAKNAVCVDQHIITVGSGFKITCKSLSDILYVVVIAKGKCRPHDVLYKLPLEEVPSKGFSEYFYQIVGNDRSLDDAVGIGYRNGVSDRLVQFIEQGVYRGALNDVSKGTCNFDYLFAVNLCPFCCFQRHSSPSVSIRSPLNVFPTAIVFRADEKTTPSVQYSTAANSALPPSYASLFFVRQET